MSRSIDKSSKSSGNAAIVVPWKYVAVGASLISIAALTTVVILTATTEADTLSSVALILAVLAFVIQIIVFIADFALNSRRDKEASGINASTQALLAAIEVKANSTNEVVKGQMAKMIDHLFEGQRLALKDDNPASPEAEVRREVLDDLQSEFRRVAGPGLGNLSSAATAPPQSRVDALRRWPTEETVERIKTARIDILSSEAWTVLVAFAEDIQRSFDLGFPEGFTIGRRDLVAELRTHHLVRSSESGIYRLSGRGMAVTRLVTAPEPIPKYIEQKIPWVRDVRSEHPFRGREIRG